MLSTYFMSQQNVSFNLLAAKNLSWKVELKLRYKVWVCANFFNWRTLCMEVVEEKRTIPMVLFLQLTI